MLKMMGIATSGSGADHSIILRLLGPSYGFSAHPAILAGGCETLQDRLIGFEQVDAGQRVDGDPLKCLVFETGDGAGEGVDDVYVEVHAAPGVVVLDLDQRARRNDIDVEFFAQLAAQRLGGRFTEFDLAAGKLPFVRMQPAGSALSEQDLVERVTDNADGDAQAAIGIRGHRRGGEASCALPLGRRPSAEWLRQAQI